MTSTRWVCDNPDCDSEKNPEQVKEKGQKYIAPFGWIIATGSWIGEMRFSIEVCSPDCMGKAVDDLHYEAVNG